MDKRLDLLVFGAHPDDAEIGMGATIYKHVKAGYAVGICDLTRAELSSNGDVATRAAEAEEASRLLGLTVRVNLGFPDRGLYRDADLVARIAAEIRRFRPRFVFAPYFQDRHPDHVRCSELVEEAVFNAKLRRYLPDLAPVTVERLYFYYINDVFEPGVVVDVSDVYPAKTRALAAYRSQFTPPRDGDSKLVATPLNQGYLERVEARDRLLGQRVNCAYAEGFYCRLPERVDLFGKGKG